MSHTHSHIHIYCSKAVSIGWHYPSALFRETAFNCRDNVEDALEKLQDILDAAWTRVQPIEEDEEKKKKLAKQVEKGNNIRLQSKKFQSDKKKERRAKIDW